MEEPHGLEPGPASPEIDPGSSWRGSAFAAPPRTRRPVFFAILAVAATTILLAAYAVSVGGGRPAPGPAAAVQGVRSAAEPLVRRATPVPQPRPTPAPTPDPAIRPLTVTVAPPAIDYGPAPARKPGTPDPDITTDHVIVVDGDSGAVLFQRNAYQPIAPASLTKIMTAILGIERGRLSDKVKVDVDAGSMAGSSLMGLEPWFDVTFQDLLYGLMLASGNDAALAIGRYVATTDEKFVKLMNEKARSLGLRCTRFANPHGLDAPDHYSCPADMVTMSRYAMQYPEFRRLVATRSYEVLGSNIDYTIYNVNPILNAYPGADGVKTGDTDNAGKCLVATAFENGHRVYVAFMRSEAGTAHDGAQLLNWAFNSFEWPPGSPAPLAGTPR
ncbi:MAG: D-alanyl-D-alanine carboxypeptidase family protein [Chloroflexota bacterium]